MCVGRESVGILYREIGYPSSLCCLECLLFITCYSWNVVTCQSNHNLSPCGI